MKTRFLAIAAAVAVVGSAGALLAVGSPARAADLGTIAQGKQSGAVTDVPMFPSAVTSKPCPTGYGDAAVLRVGRPTGPFTNLQAPRQAGGYDAAAVTFAPNRSFAQALGGPTSPVPPGDGLWYIVVECFSKEIRHAERFRTAITVSGSQWTVGLPAARAAGAPEAGASANVRIEVGVSGSTTSPPGGGGGLPVTGVGLTLIILSGVALLGGGTGAAIVAHRRGGQRSRVRPGPARKPGTGSPANRQRKPRKRPG